MVRRHLHALVAFAAVALVIASSATADKPIKEPGSAQTVTFEGATAVCAFPVQASYSAFDNFSITHLDKSGGVRWIGGAGRIVQQLTNLTNGKSVDINASGPGKITFNADGSATVDGGGPWLVGYFAGDSPSLALLLYRGHIVLNVAADGTLTLVSYVGAPPQDVCAMLA
jgi:hypothetical protein